jgi:hypothetical protein
VCGGARSWNWQSLGRRERECNVDLKRHGGRSAHHNPEIGAAPAALLSPFLRSRIRSSQSREFFSPARRRAPICIVLVRAGTRRTGAALRQRKTWCFIREEPDCPKRWGRLTTRIGGHDGDSMPLHSGGPRARCGTGFRFRPHATTPRRHLAGRIQG